MNQLNCFEVLINPLKDYISTQVEIYELFWYVDDYLMAEWDQSDFLKGNLE